MYCGISLQLGFAFPHPGAVWHHLDAFWTTVNNFWRNICLSPLPGVQFSCFFLMFCPKCSFWMDICTHNDVVFFPLWKMFSFEWSCPLMYRGFRFWQSHLPVYLGHFYSNTMSGLAFQAHVIQFPSLTFPFINFIVQLLTLWADLLDFWHAIQYSSASLFCCGCPVVLPRPQHAF